MFQVLGHTLYCYIFGLGRLSLFLDVEGINPVVVKSLVGLGAGEQYVEGMVDSAFSTFTSDQKEDIYSQLVGIGHSHFSSEDISECVNSIFTNTVAIAKPVQEEQVQKEDKKTWWTVWK